MNHTLTHTYIITHKSHAHTHTTSSHTHTGDGGALQKAMNSAFVSVCASADKEELELL